MTATVHHEAALPALIRNLALHLAPVRLNLIAAGFVDTPLPAAILGDHLHAHREQLCTTLPIRRVVGPADVASLAVHLITNPAVTGATFDIDGGQQLVEGRTHTRKGRDSWQFSPKSHREQPRSGRSRRSRSPRRS